MAKPTLQDYIDAGVLEHKPVAAGWLVRDSRGGQFCTPATEEDAQRWAEKIGGTYEWYIPIQSTYRPQPGASNDH